MSMSIDGVVNKYAYYSPSKEQTRLNLDTGADGSWSKTEVERYTEDYKAATGKTIDVQAVFDTYDADKSGTLDYSEYDKALSEDALGVQQLLELQAAAASDGSAEVESAEDTGDAELIEDAAAAEGSESEEAVKSEEAVEGEEAVETEEAAEETGEETEESGGLTLSDYMASLTVAKRTAWIKANYQAESTAGLINSMLNPSGALSNMNSLISQYGRAGIGNTSLSSLLDTDA